MLQKIKRNAEYLAKLEESEEQLRNEQTITFTMEKWKKMGDDNWEPA